MFNDILGKKVEEPAEIENKDSLIESLKYNLEEKEKLINDLLDEVTILEKRLEDYDQQTTTSMGI